MADASNLFGSKVDGAIPKARGRGRPPKSERGPIDGDGSKIDGIGNETVSGADGAIGSESAAGSESIATDPIAPENAIGAEQPAKQRRGRKPGSTYAKAEKGRVGLDPKELAPKIQGLHIMLATMTGQPAFQLSELECQLMAGSIADVSQHYEFSANSKTMSIVGLVAVCGMIYLPRIQAVRQSRPKPVDVAAMPAMPDAITPMPKDGRYNFDEGPLH